MLAYVTKCLEDHPGRQLTLELLRCILKNATEEARKKGEAKDLVLKGTMALVKLSRGNPGAFITLADIKRNAGTTGPSGGLWPWAGKVGAGILEERKRGGRKEFSIPKELYHDFVRLVDENITA